MTMRAEEHKKNIEKWKLLVKERLDSGMTVSKFCEAKGCTENMYYHWVNTIHKDDPSFVTNGRIGRSESEKRQSFVEISSACPEMVQDSRICNTGVRTPVAAVQSGSVRIELYSNADAEFIQSLMEGVSHVKA